MKAFIYKWLPLIYGCHCRDDRSFHWHGKKFPICARCTGMLIGNLLYLFAVYWIRIPFLPAVLFCLPMILDGTLQLKTPYESTNFRRFITGTFFGYGFLAAAVSHLQWCYRFGYGLTH